MSPRGLKTGFFVLEGVNAFATAYYFNYLFFYLTKHFAFGSKGNLFFGAVNGFVYIFASLYGGKFAQRRGYLNGFQVGLSIVTAALILLDQATAHALKPEDLLPRLSASEPDLRATAQRLLKNHPAQRCKSARTAQTKSQGHTRDGPTTGSDLAAMHDG